MESKAEGDVLRLESEPGVENLAVALVWDFPPEVLTPAMFHQKFSPQRQHSWPYANDASHKMFKQAWLTTEHQLAFESLGGLAFLFVEAKTVKAAVPDSLKGAEKLIFSKVWKSFFS